MSEQIMPIEIKFDAKQLESIERKFKYYDNVLMAQAQEIADLKKNLNDVNQKIALSGIPIEDVIFDESFSFTPFVGLG